MQAVRSVDVETLARAGEHIKASLPYQNRNSSGGACKYVVACELWFWELPTPVITYGAFEYTASETGEMKYTLVPWCVPDDLISDTPIYIKSIFVG